MTARHSSADEVTRGGVLRSMMTGYNAQAINRLAQEQSSVRYAGDVALQGATFWRLLGSAAPALREERGAWA